MQIFDPSLLLKRADRARRFGKVSFLWQKMIEDLRDRLLDVARDFETVAEVSPVPLIFNETLRERKNIQQRIEISPDQLTNDVLPLEPYSLDALVSWGHLHWINDLPTFLIQCRFALKPDGVFIGSLVGGETLYELRDALAQAESAMYGGVSPRISPFVQLQDMAALMQQAGFALPVADHDVLTVTYPDMKALIADLREAGQTNAVLRQNKKIPGKKFWDTAEEIYRSQYAEDGRLKATVEIISVIGWAPDASQQQPSRRGSATHRLADFLETEEQGTDDFI